MEPAQTIIGKLGGPTAVSRIAGVHRTRVSNWMRPKAKGGTDGLIPPRHVRKLLAHAQANGIKLRPTDFLQSYGAFEAAG